MDFVENRGHNRERGGPELLIFQDHDSYSLEKGLEAKQAKN